MFFVTCNTVEKKFILSLLCTYYVFLLHLVALVAGLATGIPVVVLVSIYMVYCCCRRKQQDLQEPRLWRIKDTSHDPYIPPFVPRIVQKFVQHSHQGTRNSSSATSAQTSPLEDKSFFSEDSGSYRTAPDDAGIPEKRHSLGSFEALNVPTIRRSSLLQLTTSSGDSSESIYEQRKSSDVKSPKSFPKSSSKSFEFVRPIPVKPLITITRVESKDDMSTKVLVGDVDPNGQSHSDSQVLPVRKPPKPSHSLDNVSVPSRASKERKGSTDRNLAEGRKASGDTEGEVKVKQGTLAKIPVNIPSQVIHSHKETRRRSSHSSLGRLNVSLQYKQTTCDLFIKVILTLCVTRPQTATCLLCGFEGFSCELNLIVTGWYIIDLSESNQSVEGFLAENMLNSCSGRSLRWLGHDSK